jgi:transposase
MNTLHKLYVGFDSHSKINKVALIPISALQSTRKLKEAEIIDVENNQHDFKHLKGAIRKHTKLVNQVIVGIDSCGIYTLPITHFLISLGFQVYFMEQTLSKSSRGYLFDLENKSDVIDAIRIAHLLYLRDMAGSLFRTTSLRLPDFESKSSFLHMLVLHRQQYVKLVTQSTNRLHVFLTGIFPEAEDKYFNHLIKILPYYPTPQEIARSRGMKKVKGVGKSSKDDIKKLAKETIGIPAENYRDLILNLCNQRQQALNWEIEITKLIEKEVNGHPYGPILLSFPRLGIISAATMIGTIGDISRWASDKKLKKAVGVYGSFQESGKSPSIRKQGRGGSRICKSTLYQVVVRCLVKRTPDNDFRDYYLRKVSKGKPKISAIVATMGKLTELIYHCLKTGQTYQYKGIYKKT